MSDCHVQAVEVRVDHDNVGFLCSTACVLGEAPGTLWTLLGTGALVGADGHGPPRVVVGVQSSSATSPVGVVADQSASFLTRLW